MRIDIRLYKRFDTDLVALCDAGYPLSKMLKDSVTAFAYGAPLHYLVDVPLRFDVEGKSTVHYAFTISDKDTKTCMVLKSIQKGYRNSFCKMILRNAMVNQNVGCYFANDRYIPLVEQQIQKIDRNAYENLIPLSTLTRKNVQEEISQTIARVTYGGQQGPKQENGVSEIDTPNFIPGKEGQKSAQAVQDVENPSDATSPAAHEDSTEFQGEAPGLADNDALMKIFDAL